MRQQIINYLLSAAGGGVISIVTSAFARSLPEPLPMGSRLYLFLYRFTQNLLANPDKSAATREITRQ